MYNLMNYYNCLYVYHFTDTRNLPGIQAQGGLYSFKQLEERKLLHDIYCGGNSISHKADKRKYVDDYVHLCFLRKHPIEMKARSDGRIRETAWIKVDVNVLLLEDVCYTKDISNKSNTVFLSAEEAEREFDRTALFEILDYSDRRNLERHWRVQRYEALIFRHIPLRYLHYKRILPGK